MSNLIENSGIDTYTQVLLAGSGFISISNKGG